MAFPPAAAMLPPSMKQLLAFAVLVSAGLGASPAQDINPFPRPVIKTERLLEWSFKEGLAGWTALHDFSVAAEEGVLRIRSTGTDPYLAGPPIQVPGPLVVNLRVRCATGGAGQLFWSASDTPDFAEERSHHFNLVHDGQWHDYSVPLAAKARSPGCDSTQAKRPARSMSKLWRGSVRQTLHPLEAQSVRARGRAAELTLTNHSLGSINSGAGGGSYDLPGHAAQVIIVACPAAPRSRRASWWSSPKDRRH